MKNLILILSLFAFFACNDSVNEDLSIEDEPGLTPEEHQEKLEAYYETGYHLGTSDADWIVETTWINVECTTLEFETVVVPIIWTTEGSIPSWGSTKQFMHNTLSIKKYTIDDCTVSSITQLLGFQQYVGMGPYSGYVQALEAKVASSILYNKAFYEGILAGFTDRLCGHSITMPFNFTNCNTPNVPNTPTDRVHGGPSGGGPQLCFTCES